MVCASRPVTSARRLAARPVGETSRIRFFCASKAAAIVLVVSVLPVPGPPVRMKKRFSSASAIASRCSSESAMPDRCSWPSSQTVSFSRESDLPARQGEAAADLPGEADLGIEEGGMVHRAHRAAGHLDLGNILRFDGLGGHHRLQDRRQLLRLDAQDLGRGLEQFGLRQKEMAEVGRFGERVEQARFDPLLAVDGDAQLLRDLVGGFESDPPDVLRQSVRIGLDGRDGPVAVGLVDLDRVGRGDAFGLEKQHDIADLALLVPRLLDHRDALFADALHPQKRTRVVLDDLQRLQAEQLHHPLRHHRPDAFDQAAAQILLDGEGGGGLAGVVALDRELPPELPVRRPATLAGQLLSHDRVREVADQRDEIPRPLHRQPPDRIAVLLIVVGDPFQHPDQRFERAGRSGGAVV